MTEQEIKPKHKIIPYVFILAMFVQLQSPNIVTYLICLMLLLVFGSASFVSICVTLYSIAKDGFLKAFVTKTEEERTKLPQMLKSLMMLSAFSFFLMNNAYDSKTFTVLMTICFVFLAINTPLALFNMKNSRDIKVVKKVKEEK